VLDLRRLYHLHPRVGTHSKSYVPAWHTRGLLLGNTWGYGWANAPLEAVDYAVLLIISALYLRCKLVIYTLRILHWGSDIYHVAPPILWKWRHVDCSPRTGISFVGFTFLTVLRYLRCRNVVFAAPNGMLCLKLCVMRRKFQIKKIRVVSKGHYFL
jgi:hypothetical protein